MAGRLRRKNEILERINVLKSELALPLRSTIGTKAAESLVSHSCASMHSGLALGDTMSPINDALHGLRVDLCRVNVVLSEVLSDEVWRSVSHAPANL